MPTQTIQIVDRGRGPQLPNNRITVMDVFYYLHRGRDFDFIHWVMPSLSREEFDAVVAYVNEHREELEEEDRQAEEWIKERIAEQKAKGLYHEIDESIPLEERIARLREKMRRHQAEQAEKNGAQHTR